MEAAGREGEERHLEVMLKQLLSSDFYKPPRDSPQPSPVKPVASAILAAQCETGLEGFNLLDHFLQTPAQAAD